MTARLICRNNIIIDYPLIARNFPGFHYLVIEMKRKHLRVLRILLAYDFSGNIGIRLFRDYKELVTGRPSENIQAKYLLVALHRHGEYRLSTHGSIASLFGIPSDFSEAGKLGGIICDSLILVGLWLFYIHHPNNLYNRNTNGNSPWFMRDQIGSFVCPCWFVYLRFVKYTDNPHIARLACDNRSSSALAFGTVEIDFVALDLHALPYEVGIRLEVEFELQRTDKIIETVKLRTVLETLRDKLFIVVYDYSSVGVFIVCRIDLLDKKCPQGDLREQQHTEE